MFSTLGTWNRLIFGIVLMALELMAPGSSCSGSGSQPSSTSTALGDRK